MRPLGTTTTEGIDMAAPTVTASLNKPSYAPGDTMALTVTYGDADNRAFTVTVTIDDGDNQGTATVPVNVIDPSALTVTDSEGRTWTKQTDTGSVAVFTATA